MRVAGGKKVFIFATKNSESDEKDIFNIIPSPDTACILLYGDIGGMINDVDIAAELYGYAAQYKSIDVRINSLGGSVYAGIAILTRYVTVMRIYVSMWMVSLRAWQV